MTQSVQVVEKDSSESSDRPILVHLSLRAHSGLQARLACSGLLARLACSNLRHTWPVRVFGMPGPFGSSSPLGPCGSSGSPDISWSSSPFGSSDSPEFSGSLGPIDLFDLLSPPSPTSYGCRTCSARTRHQARPIRV